MIRLKDSVLVSRVDGEAVLLDADSSEYYGLNSPGTRMLDLLADCGDQETAIQLAAAEFDAPEERIRSDFIALLNALLEKGLVRQDAV